MHINTFMISICGNCGHQQMEGITAQVFRNRNLAGPGTLILSMILKNIPFPLDTSKTTPFIPR